MKVVSSCIELENLHFRALHGVLPQERIVGGDYVVSVRVAYPMAKAVVTDNVEETINYARVYEIVRREMLTPSQLLEHVAGRIAQAVIDEYPSVEYMDVKITKKNPPMSADSDGASVVFRFEPTSGDGNKVIESV